MARGIIRLDPVKLVKDLGFPGYRVVDARLFNNLSLLGTTVDLIVDSPKIKGKHGEVMELSLPKKGAVKDYEEQEEISNQMELK